MHIVRTISAFFAATLLPMCVSAQTYPSVDADGNKIYYKILSANPGYENKCLEDNSKNSSTSSYKFLINDCAANNLYQEWEFVSGGDETYYLRNRKSRRYISTKGSWIDAYYCVESAVTSSTTKPYEFIALDNDQVALKYNNGTNDFYLCATDSAQGASGFNVYSLKDTRWAWYVADSNGTPLSIDTPITGSNVDVNAENGKIIVSGTNNYELYDVEGRQLGKQSVLLPGVYIVKANGRTYKVAVE